MLALPESWKPEGVAVSCIQSLDRLDLAEKLHQRLQFENKIIEALIQVNIHFQLLKGIQQQVTLRRIYPDSYYWNKKI
ncbi:hypothetical protein [Sphingobacterium chuzhouense]|uniref:hypothetical protein n=1 Tax=Sphingobacterium chuzhouense TaxID=1742264 RepID=UPI0036D302D7